MFGAIRGQKILMFGLKVDSSLSLEEKIKIAIQINGKTKEIIEVKKDLMKKML